MSVINSSVKFHIGYPNIDELHVPVIFNKHYYNVHFCRFQMARCIKNRKESINTRYLL
jgi:hypothetical protein